MLNFAMACYAVFLATGHSLRCRSIRSDTIKIYLHNAATFVSRFDAKDRDARKKEGETKLCPAVAAVIGIVKRYEDMKNRREPFTLGMLHLLLSKVYFFSDDSSKAALADWFTIGLHGGYRRAEWCQEKGNEEVGQEEKSPKDDSQPLAFTLSDLTFLGKNKRKLNLQAAMRHPASIMQIKVRHKWQKNGEHGQKKVMNRNKKKPKICPVEALIRIVQRFLRLHQKEVYDLPLAIYFDSQTNSIKNITDSLVTNEMRELAKELYHMDDTELKSFSCHSLRVGACCALYSQGVSKAEIKRILRWKSDSWEDYLRDLSCIAERQIAAMCDADEIPNFL